MKKIYCDWVPSDWIKVGIASDTIDPEDIIIEVKSSEEGCIRLNPSKIRKLRKQLKRVLIEVKGEKKEDDWFSAGKIVRVTNNFMGHGFPIGDMVRIVDINEDGVAKAEYLDGRDYWFLRKNECEPAA